MILSLKYVKSNINNFNMIEVHDSHCLEGVKTNSFIYPLKHSDMSELLY